MTSKCDHEYTFPLLAYTGCKKCGELHPKNQPNMHEGRVFYTIEVNVARKGIAPVWRDLRDEDDYPITFLSLDEAKEILATEDRGTDARIVCYRYGPEFPPVEVKL